MRVEVVRPDVSAEHHVVVEVNKLLGEAGDAVDVGLDGRGAESGEVAAILEDILEVRRKIRLQTYQQMQNILKNRETQSLNLLCTTDFESIS